jgi:hypothetical protein
MQDRCRKVLGGGVALRSYEPCWPSCRPACRADGTRLAGLISIYHACHVYDALCLSAARGFCHASSMHIPGRGHGIPLQDTHATRWSSLTSRGRTRAFSPNISSRQGSLIWYTFFPLPEGRAFSRTLPSPAKEEGPSYLLPSKGKGLV